MSEDAQTGDGAESESRIPAENATDGVPDPIPENVADDAPERAIDRVDYDPDYDPAGPVPCEVCGEEMYYTAACKLKCPRCGYTRDCSDP